MVEVRATVPSDAFTAGTLTFNGGTTLDLNGSLDLAGATSIALPSSGVSGGGSGSGLDYPYSYPQYVAYCEEA